MGKNTEDSNAIEFNIFDKFKFYLNPGQISKKDKKGLVNIAIFDLALAFICLIEALQYTGDLTDSLVISFIIILLASLIFIFVFALTVRWIIGWEKIES